MNRANLIWHHSRDTYMSKHHLVPKSKGGCKREHNLLRLWRDKHDAWHNLFSNHVLSDILEILLHGKYNIGKHIGSKNWVLLFGNKNIVEVYALLKRVQRMKNRLR